MRKHIPPVSLDPATSTFGRSRAIWFTETKPLRFLPKIDQCPSLLCDISNCSLYKDVCHVVSHRRRRGPAREVGSAYAGRSGSQAKRLRCRISFQASSDVKMRHPLLLQVMKKRQNCSAAEVIRESSICENNKAYTEHASVSFVVQCSTAKKAACSASRRMQPCLPLPREAG